MAVAAAAAAAVAVEAPANYKFLPNFSPPNGDTWSWLALELPSKAGLICILSSRPQRAHSSIGFERH